MAEKGGTLECIRKLLKEKGSLEQTHFVMTYLLPKDQGKQNDQGEEKEEGILGYFVLLRAFPNGKLAEGYVSEVIERTGIRSLIVVPACSLVPISTKSIGTTVPIHVNKGGQLIQIAQEQDQRDKEEADEAKKLSEMISQDHKQMEDPESIESLARSWFLLTKYRKQKEYYQNKIHSSELVIQNNEELVTNRLDQMPKVLEFLENRLKTFNENELLKFIKEEMQIQLVNKVAKKYETERGKKLET